MNTDFTITKNQKVYGPLINTSQMCELFEVTADTMRTIIRNNDAFRRARKTKSYFSLYIIVKLWLEAETPEWWTSSEEQDEEPSSAGAKLDSLLRKAS